MKDTVRTGVEETINGLPEQEAQGLAHASKYERTGKREACRSGSCTRKLGTTSGEVTLKMPKLKGAAFETAIIERYRRWESSVGEALIEMYLAGVSVRRVEDITEALWGGKVSPSTVSELNRKSYGNMEAWRNRPLEGMEHPYVYVDGIYLKRNRGGTCENVSTLMATGGRFAGFSGGFGRYGRDEGRQGGLAVLFPVAERPGSFRRQADNRR